MLRTLGGKNIGKCRLRAHQHPLLPPLSNQRSHKLPPTYLQSNSSNERVLRMTCAVFPVYTLLRASILDFRPRLANRCKLFPDSTLFRASILNFKPKLANRCKLFPDSTLFRALILNFKPKLGNQCIYSGDFRGFRAAILDFRPRIGNRCSDGSLQAKLITLRQRSRSGNEDQSRTRKVVAALNWQPNPLRNSHQYFKRTLQYCLIKRITHSSSSTTPQNNLSKYSRAQPLSTTTQHIFSTTLKTTSQHNHSAQSPATPPGTPGGSARRRRRGRGRR